MEVHAHRARLPDDEMVGVIPDPASRRRIEHDVVSEDGEVELTIGIGQPRDGARDHARR